MCGIAGIVSSGKSSLEPVIMTALVETMISTIAHRGPDASGVWNDPAGRCVLGHRRLSIIDTSQAGRQPMATGDGRWFVTFNGELYNFQELKPELEAAGIHLRGRTDTEVLIESIALWGAEAFTRFDGMFAFGAFDTQTGELLLARDPFGEKPLYYMELPGGDLAFASELQALESLPGFDGTVDLDAVAELLSFQYIGAPRSIYRNVKKLPAGHWLRRDGAARIQIGRYFQFRPGLSGFSDRPIGDLADELEDILTRSIRRRLIADVPLGAFLSGGVDSSTVCALVRRKLGMPIMTFSTGFAGAPESEHLTARAFARHLQTDHHEESLTPDAADFLLHIGELLDEPNGDSSCLPTYLLSRFARRHVTVAISGDGGDEMFGGYGRYFATLDELARHRRGALPHWTPGAAYFGNRILIAVEEHLADLFDTVPADFASRLSRMRTELDGAQDRLLCEMRRTDVDNYMPGAVLSKVDRMSMQHGLEVRTPYLSVELARFAERLPDLVLVRNGSGKRVLREVAYRYLPRQLIDLPKQGFGLPMSDWAQTNLLNVATKLFESDDSRLNAMFGARAIERFMRRQRTPGQFSAYQVWCVAMLESWLRHHPAKLPALAERPIAQRRQIGVADTYNDRPVAVQLTALSVTGGDYLLFRPPGSPSSRTGLDAIFKYFALDRAVEALDRLRRHCQGEPSIAAVRFPEWGTPLTADDVPRLHTLRGATLICLEWDMARQFDYPAYLKLHALGVRRLVFCNPFVDEEICEIEIVPQTLAQRAYNVARLLPHAIAIASNRGWLGRFGAKHITATAQGWYQTDAIESIKAELDSDLSRSVMLFEGARQMPPVHVSHADIVTKGNGRYSIWNQVAIFSPTETTRIDNRPYWLVPLNERTRPFLQMRPRVLEQQRGGETANYRVIAKMLSEPETRPFKLCPGDSVVVCTHALAPGGAERQWTYLAQALSDAGYLVTFVTYNPIVGDDEHYLPWLRQSNISVVDASKVVFLNELERCVNSPEAMALLCSNLVPEREKLVRLVSAFAAAKPKAVFTQLDEPNILAGFAAHLAGVPRVVTSFRNYNPTNLPDVYKAWYRRAYRLLSMSNRMFFSGNHRNANIDYAEWIGMAPERIVFIPNTVDPKMFPIPTEDELARTRAELGIGAGAQVLLGAFRLSVEKDPLVFVDVCAQIVKEIPDLKVLLVGVGPMLQKTKEQVAKLGLQRNVWFLGRRIDMNVLMKVASLFLLTSAKEGMPNVLMEAQLMGTPVVATKAGGIPETVIDGETGSLHEIGDVEGLANACIRLLRDPCHAKRIGAAAQRHALTAFPNTLIGHRYLDLVQQDLLPLSFDDQEVQISSLIGEMTGTH